MTETKAALRVFLKNEAGAVAIDLTMFLGESLELAMIVTGVASSGALVPANRNADPTGAVQSEPIPAIRVVT